MKRLLCCLLLGLCRIALCAGDYDYSFLPDPLLKCDGEPLSREEGVKILKKSFTPLHNTSQAEVKDRLREAIVGEFCRTLLSRELVKKKVIPSGKMVMDYLAERERLIPEPLRSKYAPSVARKRELASDRDYRLSIALRAYFLQYDKELIRIRPEEIEWFYRCHQDQFMVDGKMDVAFIGVAGRTAASKEAIEAARARLLQGEPFASVAEEYNRKLPENAFSGGKLPQELLRAGVTLEPGATSGILSFPYGYAIVQLRRKAIPKYLTLQEVTPFIEETLRRQILTRELQKRLSKAIRSHKIELFF